MSKTKNNKAKTLLKRKTKQKKDFFIHPTVIIEDDVEIGDGTKIWHYATVRRGAKIGQNCIVAKSVFIDFDSEIGNNVKIQNHAIIYHQAIIGDGVFIGPNVCFTNDKIPRAINPDGTLKSADDWEVSTIKIGKGAAIGGHSVILPGVTVGQFAMAGSGSVVTKDVPDFALVYGNPARVQGFVCRCGAKIKSYEPLSTGKIIGFCRCGLKIEIAQEVYQLWQQSKENPSSELKSIHPDWKIASVVVKDLPHIATMLSLPLEYYQTRIKKIGFFGRETNVLDAACGSGVWAMAASRLNREVQAIDATEKYLAVAEEVKKNLKIENLKLEIGKLENLPYPNNYFDYMICYNAWMYTRRQESLKEMGRVLKSGGRIYLGCISGLGYYLMLALQGLREGNRGLILTALRAMRDRVYMTKKESRDLLEKQGFRILGMGPDGVLGDQKIKVKPIFSAKFLGFWKVYEILAEKPKINQKSKIKNQNEKE